MSIFELMAAPFAECLILVAIHTYLGIHVLKRRVIFVDLALAQFAALGTTVGFLLGLLPETPASLLFSMVFAFLGAGVFAITRFRHERVPQEAIIGLSYAIAFAVAVLVVQKTKGAEHLESILVGNLLWVSWKDVGAAAAAYAVIGVIHFSFRKQFFMISEDPDAAYKSGMSVRVWDFLFYLTFGVVIAYSTRVAGVLLVFVFLVAPGILACMITTNVRLQLLIGWVTGTVVTVVGLYLSWVLDLASGPAVISFYGVALVLGGVVIFIVRAEHTKRALGSVLLGTVVTAATGLAIWFGGSWLATTSLAASVDHATAEQYEENERLAANARLHSQQHSLEAVLASRVGQCVTPRQIAEYVAVAEPDQRLALATRAESGSVPCRLPKMLLALADDELPPLFREEVSQALVQALGDAQGYKPEMDVAANQQALSRICSRVATMEKCRHDG